MTDIPQWLRNEVSDGLAALVALRLKNAPAEDMVDLTADIWERAFVQRVSIEAVDAPRIRAGFNRIFPTIREWPAPLDVIELMPPRPKRPELPAPKPSAEEEAESAQRVKAMIDELKQKLFIPREYGRKEKSLDRNRRMD